MILTTAWHEVRVSYILGQYAAALALGTAFLEFVLNNALSNSKPLTLHAAIERCRGLGIINVKTAETLLEIKRFIRNRYLHGDYSSIAGDAEVRITAGKLSRGKLTLDSTESSTVSKVPLAQVLQKKKHDEAFARPTLQFIRAVAEELIKHNASHRQE